MSYKRVTLLLLLLGGLYLFGGLDQQKEITNNGSAADAGWASRMPVFIPTQNESQTRILYGSILLLVGGVYFFAENRRRKST